MPAPERPRRLRSLRLLRPITSLFLWASGADPQILQACGRMESYERRRMTGQGALVLIPAVLASVSMAYAASTVTPNRVVATMVGVVLGAIILAIDRYIVSTVHKAQRSVKALLRAQDSPTTATKPLPRRTGLVAAAARVATTLLLSAVISDPIVLLINAGSIHQQLIDNQRTAIAAIQQHARAVQATLPAPPGLVQAKAQLTTAQALSGCLGVLLSDEQSGVKATLPCGTSSGIPYQGFRFSTDLIRKQQADHQVRSLQTQVNTLNAGLRKQQTFIENQAAKQVGQLESAFSFDYPARLHALQQLAQHDPEVLALELLLFGFFVVLDLTALSLKLSTPASAYEAALDALTEESVVAVTMGAKTSIDVLRSPVVLQAKRTRLEVEAELSDLVRTVQDIAGTQAAIAAEIHAHNARAQDDPVTSSALSRLATTATEHIASIIRRIFPATNIS